MDGFDEQRLLGGAAAHLGVDAPLEAELRPALRALLSGLREDAELSPVGAWRASARLMNALSQRAALRRFESETPELASLEPQVPIFISGLSRVTSSLLHNLLARAPGLWAPRLWELHDPVPPAWITERWIDRQIRAAEAMLEQLDEAAPELRRVHVRAATAPDECSWLFRGSFSSLDHALRWFMPSYVAFMAEAALEPAYRDHHRWLRALAWRHRHDDLAGPRVVLADPWHMGQLDALFSVYPNARVIQIHGHPSEVLPELARSCWLLQGIDARRAPSKPAIGRYCVELVSTISRANAAARERLGSERFIDVSHRAVLEDPIAVVRQLGRRLNFPITEQALRDANRWLLDNRFAARTCPARLEEFGLERRAVDREFAEHRLRLADPLVCEPARLGVG
jgi:hypothetical protein